VHQDGVRARGRGARVQGTHRPRTPPHRTVPLYPPSHAPPQAAAGDGRGNNTGAVSVYSQTSLRLTAVLCDGGILTEARTAAASAYACRAAVRRAKATVTGVGIVGGGVQAVWQLRLLGACGAVDPAVAQVVVKTRSRASAEAFVRRMAASSFPPDRRWRFAHFEDSVRFRRCQLVLTLTTSRSPVLGMEDVALAGNAFLHVSAVGSDSPGKCEISTELLSSADLLLVDSIAQSKERGEFQPGRWGEGTVPDLVEIGTEGTVVNGALAAGTDRHLFTVFDSSGIAMQDVQMAKLMAGHLQSGAS